MDVLAVAGTDGAILMFSLAGLFVTAVAILADTRSQRADLARNSVRVDRAL